MLQNVTPKKLFEPKLDYDVINAKLIKKTRLPHHNSRTALRQGLLLFLALAMNVLLMQQRGTLD